MYTVKCCRLKWVFGATLCTALAPSLPPVRRGCRSENAEVFFINNSRIWQTTEETATKNRREVNEATIKQPFCSLTAWFLTLTHSVSLHSLLGFVRTHRPTKNPQQQIVNLIRIVPPFPPARLRNSANRGRSSVELNHKLLSYGSTATTTTIASVHKVIYCVIETLQPKTSWNGFRSASKRSRKQQRGRSRLTGKKCKSYPVKPVSNFGVAGIPPSRYHRCKQQLWPSQPWLCARKKNAPTSNTRRLQSKAMRIPVEQRVAIESLAKDLN